LNAGSNILHIIHSLNSLIYLYANIFRFSMELNQFIVKANKRTYASGNEGKKLSDGGKAFVYEEDGFKLRDVYYGFSPFAGQTVVWKDDEPVWIMN
jgi:hypothetical protein